MPGPRPCAKEPVQYSSCHLHPSTIPVTCTVLGAVNPLPEIPQEPSEGRIMWKQVRRACMARKGRAGFGLLVLLALKIVHSTTLPLFNVTSPASLRETHRTQSPTLSWWYSLTHLPAFLLPPPHVTGCDMHTHTSHKFTLLWTSQPQAQLHSRDTMGQGPLCHHLPQDTPRAISRLELFQSLVNSGTSEGPQDGLTILLGSLEPLPQTLHRSCWHSVTQENVTWPGRQKT